MALLLRWSYVYPAVIFILLFLLLRSISYVNFNSSYKNTYISDSRIEVLCPNDWFSNMKMWENDFIDELFPGHVFHFTSEYNYSNPAVIICSTNHKKHLRQLELIKKLTSPNKKVPILIHLSNEQLGLPNHIGNACSKFYDHANLVLRQHNLLNYSKHVMQLPLGYKTGFLKKSTTGSSSVVANQSLAFASTIRKFQWSFIGRFSEKKPERKHAIEVFSSWKENFMHTDFPVEDILDLYRHSKFVVSPRGYNSIDCFRHYEALMAGAIPIIVGSDEERTLAFHYNGDELKIPVYRSWEEALVRCRAMSAQEIDALRVELFNWYQRRVSAIQGAIVDALNLTKSQYHSAIPSGNLTHSE